MGAHNRLLVSGMEMIFQLAVWVGEGMGKSTAEVLEEAVRDCKRRTAGPTAVAIDADLPEGSSPR